ncbi:MAG TPA: Trm112 family protein [Acidimicrobiales bacterium]|nr:Trm112 family protein [Acidimicrobiales bacterium]
MPLDPLLVEILVCPEDKQPLWYLEDESSLVNLRLRRRYRIADGIPVLLVDECEALDDAEVARLEAKLDASGVLTGTGSDAGHGGAPRGGAAEPADDPTER